MPINPKPKNGGGGNDGATKALDNLVDPVLNAPIDANENTISNLPAPTDFQDAANKRYVDNRIITEFDFEDIEGQIAIGQIPDKLITGLKIADETLTGSKIADETIAATNISDNAVTNTKILNATITGAKIANATISNDKIGSVGLSKLDKAGAVNGQVLTWVDGVNSYRPVTSGGGGGPVNFSDLLGFLELDQIPNQLITGPKLASKSININKLTPTPKEGEDKKTIIYNEETDDFDLGDISQLGGEIESNQIGDLIISSSKIVANAVTGAKIANATITNDKIIAVGLAKLEKGNAVNGQVATWDEAAQMWVPKNAGGGGAAVDTFKFGTFVNIPAVWSDIFFDFGLSIGRLAALGYYSSIPRSLKITNIGFSYNGSRNFNQPVKLTLYASNVGGANPVPLTTVTLPAGIHSIDLDVDVDVMFEANKQHVWQIEPVNVNPSSVAGNSALTMNFCFRAL